MPADGARPLAAFASFHLTSSVSLPLPPLIEQLQARTPRVTVTWWLIAANGVVFAIMLGYGAGLWHSDNGVQLAWGANFGPATKDGEWWRLGSALFLHFGLFHLAVNMFSLWDGGRLVERMYGPRRFVLIYFCSGLVGNLLSLIAQGDRAVSGGASGAIFGVFGALMVFLWHERSRLNPSEFRWLFWAALGFSVVSIGLGLQITGIDNAAHIGGLVGGTLAGAALIRPLDPAHRGGRARWLAQACSSAVSRSPDTAGARRSRLAPKSTSSSARTPASAGAGVPSSTTHVSRKRASISWPDGSKAKSAARMRRVSSS